MTATLDLTIEIDATPGEYFAFIDSDFPPNINLSNNYSYTFNSYCDKKISLSKV